MIFVGQREDRENEDAYLYSLHQQHSLRIVLVRLQDEVSQLVDDDVQGTLLLQGLAEVQLGMEEQPKVKGYDTAQTDSEVHY